MSVNELPQHTHELQATNVETGATDNPSGAVLARSIQQIYGEFTTPAQFGSGTVANVGGGQSHENMQPYLAVNYCIALQGLFPSRN